MSHMIVMFNNLTHKREIGGERKKDKEKELNDNNNNNNKLVNNNNMRKICEYSIHAWSTESQQNINTCNKGHKTGTYPSE